MLMGSQAITGKYILIWAKTVTPVINNDISNQINKWVIIPYEAELKSKIMGEVKYDNF
jgi:hypothetical protein